MHPPGDPAAAGPSTLSRCKYLGLFLRTKCQYTPTVTKLIKTAIRFHATTGPESMNNL
jgi:hypothetical protein